MKDKSIKQKIKSLKIRTCKIICRSKKRLYEYNKQMKQPFKEEEKEQKELQEIDKLDKNFKNIENHKKEEKKLKRKPKA